MRMSVERINCEQEIKYLIDLRQRFRQYLKENLNTIWYSDAQDYFNKDCELMNTSLIECICDLVNINQLLSNESHDDVLLQLKCEKSMNIHDKHDESMKQIYFNRRYRALINSRGILLDDLSQSIDENRMVKLRAICVLDEELFHLQEDFSLKSLSEQAAIRLHQIRAMINVFFKQTSSFSIEDNNPALIPLIHSCDSLLSTFRLFLNDTSLDISLNSLSDIQNDSK